MDGAGSKGSKSSGSRSTERENSLPESGLERVPEHKAEETAAGGMLRLKAVFIGKTAAARER